MAYKRQDRSPARNTLSLLSLRVVYASIGGGTYKVTVYTFFRKNHTFPSEFSPPIFGVDTIVISRCSDILASQISFPLKYRYILFNSFLIESPLNRECRTIFCYPQKQLQLTACYSTLLSFSSPYPPVPYFWPVPQILEISGKELHTLFHAPFPVCCQFILRFQSLI